MNKIDVKLKDFQLCSEWVSHEDEHYVEDRTTGRAYATVCSWTTLKALDIRSMCLFTSFGVIPALTCVFNLIARMVILVSGYSFWRGLDTTTPYNFKERFIDALHNLTALLATPLTFIALECAAMYGMIHPSDGRKLYASIERLSFLFVGLLSFQPMFLSHDILDFWTWKPHENYLQKLLKDTVNLESDSLNKILKDVKDRLKNDPLDETERKQLNDMVDEIRRLKDGDIRLLEKYISSKEKLDKDNRACGGVNKEWEAHKAWYQKYEEGLNSPENRKKVEEFIKSRRERRVVEVTVPQNLDDTAEPHGIVVAQPASAIAQPGPYEDYSKHFERNGETNSSQEYDNYGPLTFKSSQGQGVCVSYSSTACVGHLRTFLHVNYGYPLATRIVFAGKVLKDGEVLSRNKGKGTTLKIGVLQPR